MTNHGKSRFIPKPPPRPADRRPARPKADATPKTGPAYRDCETYDATHGDRVMAEISGETTEGRVKARILKVLARSAEPLPAHLQKQAWGWRAIPIEPRMSQIIAVPETDLAQDGDFVSVLLDPDLAAK